jgi:hypothetical protein
MDTIDTETLFNDLEPLITQSLNRIAYMYRHRYPADFEDISQLVKMDIWRTLPKLLALASSMDSLTRLVVTAINYSFKSHYRDVRKKNKLELTVLEEAERVGEEHTKRADLLIDLSNMQSKVLKSTLDRNRWTGDEQEAVNYCCLTLLHGREPSRKILKSVYNVNKGMYLIHYSRVLLKICVLDIVRRGLSQQSTHRHAYS